jgi:hypothetical protein
MVNITASAEKKKGVLLYLNTNFIIIKKDVG